MHNLPDQLRQLRIAAGLTQQQLAKRLAGGGYPQGVVSAIESGKRTVGLNMLRQWVDACGATLNLSVSLRAAPAKESGTVWDLDRILISARTRAQWLAMLPFVQVDLSTRYPDLTGEKIGDEQFRENADGSGEIFVRVRNSEINLPIPAGEWGFVGLN